MEEPFLPWWLVLLVGMWVVALAVWQHPGVPREIRLWAGLSTLVYLGLIFLALGIRPRTNVSGASFLSFARIASISVAICFAVALTPCVWMLGPVSSLSRQMCYVLLTMANACTSALMGASEIAVGLLVVGLISMWPLVGKWSRPQPRPLRERLIDLTRFRKEFVAQDKFGEFWLIGGLNGILACALFGTLSYSLRIETTRAAPSPRYSALPSVADLIRIHSPANDSNQQTSSLALAFGKRADVVVLLAVIVFVCLAISRIDSAEMTPKMARVESVSTDHSPTDLPSEELR